MKQSRTLTVIEAGYVRMISDEKRRADGAAAAQLEQRVRIIRDTFGIPETGALHFGDGPDGTVVAEWDAPDIAPLAEPPKSAEG